MEGYRNAPFRVRDHGGVVWLIRVEGKVGWVIRIILGDSIWKSATGIIVSIKHIPDPRPGLGPSQARPDNLESRAKYFVSATNSRGKNSGNPQQ